MIVHPPFNHISQPSLLTQTLLYEHDLPETFLEEVPNNAGLCAKKYALYAAHHTISFLSVFT